jgi:mannose-6-phosphate isomerase
MVKLYPLTFAPIFKERIWGGRNLQTLYAKPLPPDRLIGESWEISDRPGDESLVARGPLQGKSLHWLMEQCPAELLGDRRPAPSRFPLLIKIIDAHDTLSLQVHPPPSVAARLGGEPKSEFWYVARADSGAALFAGLKKGVTRADFERHLAAGTVADAIHRIPASNGDALFLPSGRIHALGTGTVVFEVQQNSDTTYRVFDWNRLDDAGKPRQLHVSQALASINFDDAAPSLLSRTAHASSPGTIRPLVSHDLFEVDLLVWPAGGQLDWPPGRMRILGVVGGSLRIEGAGESVELAAGQFCLVPACCQDTRLRARSPVSFLQIQ